MTVRRMTFTRLLWVACVVLWHALSGAPVFGADPEAPSQYAVKAEFLHNFAKFIEWPEAASGVTRGPIALCVFAGAPYAEALAAIDGKSAQGRTLQVRRGVHPDEIKSCHMLFVAESEERSIPELLRLARDRKSTRLNSSHIQKSRMPSSA